MKMNTVNFERKKGKPLYEQVCEKIQEDILSGYLKKGDQLPSIRAATSLFKVSKTSIENAYEQLLMDGLIISVPQIGYFIDVDDAHVTLRRAMISHPKMYEEDVIRYDFRSQTMDRDAFDMTLWKKYLKEVLDHHQEITTYGDARGEKALRMALAEYAYAMRGVLCHENQIVVGSSFQSLLYVLFGLMKKPCIMGLEEEGFLPAQTVCEDYGIKMRFLHSHHDGPAMDELYASDVNVLYLNAGSCGENHQPISRQKRRELLAWAEKKQAWIIEDDHNGELRYHSRQTPAMQGFDTKERIIYIGSFSKLLLPSLRISYMVLCDELQHVYESRIDSYSPTSSKIEQLALAHYIRDGHLERHVKRLRKRYSIKSSYMQELLEKYFKDADIFLEESALQFLIRFHQPMLLDDIIQKAKEASIRVSCTKHHELVLSFAAIAQNDMEEAVALLYTIVENVRKKYKIEQR